MRISTEDHQPRTVGTVLAVDAAGGMSATGKLVAAILTALLLLGAGIALGMAGGLPTLGGRAQVIDAGANGVGASDPARLGSASGDRAAADVPAGASELPSTTVQAEWDGPAVHLDWTGAEYARAETTFIGDRKASPGDRVVRTLNVVNAGPGDGIAAVTLDVSELIPDGALNPDLAADVTLFWDVAGVTGEETFAALNAGGRISVAEVAVQRGATVPVTFGFAMDREIETSNATGVPSTELSFDVGVNLTGETVKQEIVVTGGAGILALICIALALLLLGVVLVLARRRRREEPRPLLIHGD